MEKRDKYCKGCGAYIGTLDIDDDEYDYYDLLRSHLHSCQAQELSNW